MVCQLRPFWSRICGVGRLWVGVWGIADERLSLGYCRRHSFWLSGLMGADPAAARPGEDSGSQDERACARGDVATAPAVAPAGACGRKGAGASCPRGASEACRASNGRCRAGACADSGRRGSCAAARRRASTCSGGAGDANFVWFAERQEAGGGSERETSACGSRPSKASDLAAGSKACIRATRESRQEAESAIAERWTTRESPSLSDAPARMRLFAEAYSGRPGGT